MSAFHFTNRRVAILEKGHRFWVFAQARGARAPFKAALDFCKSSYQPGDRFVFLGSQIGLAGSSLPLISDLIDFRHWVDSQNGKTANITKVVWLRGIQEELLEMFYSLQFAADPREVFGWMVKEHQFDFLLRQLGYEVNQIFAAAGQGAAALQSLTGQIRARVRQNEDMAFYFDSCARAGISDQGQLLFVHAGVDPARTLSLQTDAFFWGHPDFFRLKKPYQNFSLVLSTLTPPGEQRIEGPGRLAIDKGCGISGPLCVLCLDPWGQELFNYDFGIC